MNIIKDFYDIFGMSTHDVSERIKVLESTFRYNEKILPPIDRIKDILKTFPERDEVTITLSTTYGDAIILSNKSDDIKGNNCIDFYEDREEDDEVIVQLEIKKNIFNNVFSVYNFNEFSSYILDKKLIQVVGFFHELLLNQEYLVFELFDSDLHFSTSTMIFKSYPATGVENRFMRLEKVNTCKQISSFYNMSDYNLIPEDFDIKLSDNNVFDSIFSKLKTLFSMIYISNTSIINNSNLSIEIIGQRKTNFIYDINNDINDNNELYKIYLWIATDGNAIDKSIIARNIISLHCQFTDIIKTDPKTFSSIQSNFRLYQKDNVGQYIELKNKLGEYILNIINSTSDIVIGLGDKLKTNMMACFTFLLTAVIANIISDQPLNNIFTKDITFILEFVIFASFLYIRISKIEVAYKLKKLKDGYYDLKKNYYNILDVDDIKEIFNDDKILKDNLKEVKSKEKTFILTWVILLIACLLGIEFISTHPIILPIFKKILYGFLELWK